MKISGFTFIRNGNDLGYPFIASIRSLLALCDEVIVNVPCSSDDTYEAVLAINDPKIRIIQTEWDAEQKSSGLVLSHHTNLALEQCTGDWCVYIQGDEVLHEDSLPAIRANIAGAHAQPDVQGLLVDYTHFYGSFFTEVYSFGWYYREVRIIRNDPNIRSRGDAQGFRTLADEKLRVKNSGGRYFHYGYALEPDVAQKKLGNLKTLFSAGQPAEVIPPKKPCVYDDDQKVKPFTGTHPGMMTETVAAATWTYRSRLPLIRFREEYFWEDIALILKRCTGLTLGVHKNYRLLK